MAAGVRPLPIHSTDTIKVKELREEKFITFERKFIWVGVGGGFIMWVRKNLLWWGVGIV